jgi:hypothetical protein
LALAVCGLGSAACNDDPVHYSGITTAAPVVVVTTAISPSLIGLTSLSGFQCSGSVFTASFNLVVGAGSQNVTMNELTLHLLDGTNVGGPSVTIPSSQLITLFGTTVIPGGASREFALQPVFPCTVTQPNSLDGVVVLTDQRGTQQTMKVSAAIR